MKVLCEVSVRHVHLTQTDLEILFGKGAKLEFERALSQPGQFLSKQRVTLIGPKREIENVAILGPVRSASQVEIARTDAFTLGIKDVPLRQSGDVAGTPGIVLKNGSKTIGLTQGVIVAKRHVHFDTKTAHENGFYDGEIVNIILGGERGGVFNKTVVRVHDNFAPAIHIDSDEGNAMFAETQAEVQKCK